MTDSEALEYLESWGSRRRAQNEDLFPILEMLGSPEKTLKYVHVAGTNGKGSISAMTASVLQAAGYRTGLYTSPHLIRWHERVQINGEPITDEAFTRLMERIARAEEASDVTLTVFQRMTLLAFLYFREEKADIVVLEVGMGGERDATNVIPDSELAVIAPIGLEHTAQLGKTVEEIAAVKAGILRPGRPAAVEAQSEEALSVIREKARTLGCPLSIADPSCGRILHFDLKEQVFEYGEWNKMELGLAGHYQYDNAVTVLEGIGLLRKQGWKIPDRAVRKGLAEAHWPARFEFVRTEPPFFLDGAHNPHGVEALEKTIRSYFGEKKLLLICSIMSDKDRRSMLSLMKPHIKKLFVVRSDSPRSLDAAFLAEDIREHEGIDAAAAPSVEEGLRMILAEQGPDDIAGSFGCLYLAGALRGRLLHAE